MRISNPRARMLCILEKTNLTDIKKLLKYAYDQHKFIDIAVLSWAEHYDENIKFFQFIITLCTYNPFYDNGYLFCRNITERDPSNAVNEVDEYMKDRLLNLHGYPLKVIQVKSYFWHPFELFREPY